MFSCWEEIEANRDEWKPVVLHTSRFAYKSIRIQVDSNTSRSFRWHDLDQFAYIEVDSPTLKKKSSHKHSHRIAIGQRNKFNLKRRYARVVAMCRALFLFGTANVLTARRLSSSLIQVSGHFATKLIRFKLFRYNSTVDWLHIHSRFATFT